jgi:hypothetical protein
MKSYWTCNRLILSLIALAFFLYSPAFCSAQEILSNWEPFQPQPGLATIAPAPGKSSLDMPPIRPEDRLYFDQRPLFRGEEKKDRQDEDAKWSIYSWGWGSMSLSTMQNRIPKRDISGASSYEDNRWEMIKSLTTKFSDLSSREGFQYFGEMFEPELKLGIKF